MNNGLERNSPYALITRARPGPPPDVVPRLRTNPQPARRPIRLAAGVAEHRPSRRVDSPAIDDRSRPSRPSALSVPRSSRPPACAGCEAPRTPLTGASGCRSSRLKKFVAAHEHPGRQQHVAGEARLSDTEQRQPPPPPPPSAPAAFSGCGRPRTPLQAPPSLPCQANRRHRLRAGVGRGAAHERRRSVPTRAPDRRRSAPQRPRREERPSPAVARSGPAGRGRRAAARTRRRTGKTASAGAAAILTHVRPATMSCTASEGAMAKRYGGQTARGRRTQPKNPTPRVARTAYRRVPHEDR